MVARGRVVSAWDPAQWRAGYARQARADLQARACLIRGEGLAACAQLHFPQMAVEKLCRAYRCFVGEDPSSLQSSHAYARKHLPQVVRHYAGIGGVDDNALRGLLRFVRQLAGVIDLLHPQANLGGARPDNCEYPWETVGPQVVAPCDYTFPILSSRVADPRWRQVERVIARAVEDLAKDPSATGG